MRHAKKIAAIFLAVLLVFSAVATAFAVKGDKANTDTKDGTISIINPIPGKEYGLYKMLTLESFDFDKELYAYKAGSSNWATVLKVQDGDDKIDGKYLNYNDTTKIFTWHKLGASEAEEAKHVEEFAKKAKEVAIKTTKDADENNNITPDIIIKFSDEKVATKTKGDATINVTYDSTSNKITITPLSLGYYLLDSNAGALCSLNTTDKSAEIKEKNSVPELSKKIFDTLDNAKAVSDSTKVGVKKNIAQIGDTMSFRVSIKAGNGAENYILTDTLDDGFDLDTASITVFKNSNVITSGFTTDTSTTNKIVITFTDLTGITDTDYFHVVYSAKLNSKAKISTDVNNNTAKLEYGDGQEVQDSTTTETLKFDLIKYKKPASTKILLPDAEFKLYTQLSGGNPVTLLKKTTKETKYFTSYNESTNPTAKLDVDVYRIYDGNTTPEGWSLANNDTIVVTNGLVVIEGLRADETTYYLEETKAPTGYNLVAGRVQVDMSDESNRLGRYDIVDGENAWTSTNLLEGLGVLNQSGTRLPETGGIGTVLFYVAGGIVVLGAFALIVIRRRRKSN